MQIPGLVRRFLTTYRHFLGLVFGGLRAYVRANKKIPPEMVMTVASIDDPSRLGDTVVSHLTVKLEDRAGPS